MFSFVYCSTSSMVYMSRIWATRFKVDSLSLKVLFVDDEKKEHTEKISLVASRDRSISYSLMPCKRDMPTRPLIYLTTSSFFSFCRVGFIFLFSFTFYLHHFNLSIRYIFCKLQKWKKQPNLALAVLKRIFFSLFLCSAQCFFFSVYVLKR